METPRLRDFSISNLCTPKHAFRHKQTYFVGGYDSFGNIAYMIQAKEPSTWPIIHFQKGYNSIVIYWRQNIGEVHATNELEKVFSLLRQKPKKSLDKILSKDWQKFSEWKDEPKEDFSTYIREIEHLILQDI